MKIITDFDIIYVHVGNDHIVKDLIKLRLDRFTMIVNKPAGCFWAGKYLGKDMKYKSEWHRHSNKYGCGNGNLKEHVLFKIKKGNKIIDIDGAESYKRIIKRYGVGDSYKYIEDAESCLKKMLDYGNQIPPIEELVEYNTKNAICYNKVKINYEKMLRDGYSGVYVSDEIIHRFWGWDVESLVLFDGDCIEEIV